MYPNDVFDYESGFSLITQSIPVPQTYKQAKSNESLPAWKPAIDVEFGSLPRSKTWTLVKKFPKRLSCLPDMSIV